MKHHTLSRYLYIFYSSVFLFHTINIFVDSERLHYIIGILAILMLVLSFLWATLLFKILGSSFLLVGGYLFFYNGNPVSEIPRFLTSNISLLALLCMLPWMSSVVWSGRFDKSLNTMMKYNVSDLGALYLRSSATTLSLAAFLNLSAMSITQDVLKDNLAKIDTTLRNSFMTMSTLRGFSLAVLWSPLEILLAVTIFVTGVSYVSLLPWLLLIAVITFALDNIWGRFYFKKHPYEIDGKMKVNKNALIKKFIYLTVALGTFLILVILCGSILEISFILSVTLLIFPFSFIWSLVLKRVRSFLIIGWNTWKQKTNIMQNFIVLFISLSFFTNSLSNTTFLEAIQKPALFVTDFPLLIFFVIQLLFIFMSLFGIHPIAIIGILTGLFATLIEVFNPLSLAIVIITSAMATLTVSTYGLIVTLTAINTKQSPYKITWMNMPYALMFGGIGSVVAFFLL